MLFPTLQPLLNCQILLTSLFPEECNCILFPPCSCRVPAACQCKQFPSLPHRRAPEAREQRRLDGLQAACPCRVAGLTLAVAGTGNQDIWCCVPGRWALCFPSPVVFVLGELGLGHIGLASGRLGVCGLHPSRGQLVMPACCSLCHPPLHLGSQPWREHHSCVLLPVPVEVVSSITKRLVVGLLGGAHCLVSLAASLG